MEKLTPDLLFSRPMVAGATRGYRGRRCAFLFLTVLLLLGAAAGEPRMLAASGIGNRVASDHSVTGRGESQRQRERAVRDPIYDHFLQGFGPLRADGARRSYLAAEVMTAANQNRIDPDLLFALVAVESSFNSAAVSRKGARGLGQIMFATGRTVAPRIVRGPEDLDSVPRNLHVAALYLRQLLMEQEGDLRAALTAYHMGSAVGHMTSREANEYVDRICRQFASLKTKREYRGLIAMMPGDGAMIRN
jgi:transglycosylase-like protein with SLT domain